MLEGDKPHANREGNGYLRNRSEEFESRLKENESRGWKLTDADTHVTFKRATTVSRLASSSVLQATISREEGHLSRVA